MMVAGLDVELSTAGLGAHTAFNSTFYPLSHTNSCTPANRKKTKKHIQTEKIVTVICHIMTIMPFNPNPCSDDTLGYLQSNMIIYYDRFHFNSQ